MYYMICATDVPDSLEKRLAARPDHLARLEALKSEGLLLIAGPSFYALANSKTRSARGDDRTTVREAMP